MSAGLGWFPHVVSGAPRQRGVVASVTASRLGLIEYAAIPPAGGVSPVDSVDADASPAGRSLLCLVLPAPRLPQRARSGSRAGMASVIFHTAVISLVISVAAWSRSTARAPDTAAESMQLPRLVFLLRPEPGGGGGGGGNRQLQPPSRAKAIGQDRLTVPVTKRVEVRSSPQDNPSPPPQVLLEAKPLASGTAVMTGLPEASPSLPLSSGPGSGGGVGGGTGSGIGPGSGPGMGEGSGGGFGGGAYRLGRGVTPPTLLKQVKPRYTAAAMRQQIQGNVALEVVVSREGIPVAIRVTRSLDPGLDEEAIAAAREWRFTPGRVGSTPVDVLVTIVLDFSVR